MLDSSADVKFRDSCKWTKSTLKRDIKEKYWNHVSEYVDLPFKCAHNMKQKHTIDGKIFQYAYKALHQCEFVKVKTIGDGNCGFDAVIKAVTSDQKYHGSVIARGLPTSVKSLRERLAKKLIKLNIDQKEVVRTSWMEQSDSSDKQDVRGRYKRMA